jgi:hypothetical protein
VSAAFDRARLERSRNDHHPDGGSIGVRDGETHVAVRVRCRLLLVVRAGLLAAGASGEPLWKVAAGPSLEGVLVAALLG